MSWSRGPWDKFFRGRWSGIPSWSNTIVSGVTTEAHFSFGTGINFFDSLDTRLTGFVGRTIVFTDSTGKTLTGTIVTDGTTETLDTQKFSNADFASAEPPGTAWTRAAGWTVSGGVGVAVTVNQTQAIFQSAVQTAGQLWKLQWDLVSRTAGLVRTVLDGGTAGTNQSVPATYITYRTLVNSGANNEGIIGSTSPFSGTIDNVFLWQVTAPSSNGAFVTWGVETSGFARNGNKYSYRIF